MFFLIYGLLFYTCHVYENIKILKGDFKNLSITWNIHQVLLVVFINISLFLYTDVTVAFCQSHIIETFVFLILLMVRELLFKMMSLKICNHPKTLKIMTLIIILLWGVTFQYMLIHQLNWLYYPFFTIASQCIFLYIPFIIIKSVHHPVKIFDFLGHIVFFMIGFFFIIMVLFALYYFLKCSNRKNISTHTNV
jgi:hypothetical protein